MQKMEKKFLFLIVLLIISIIVIAAFATNRNKWIDRNSYVELISGTALLNEKPLEKNKKEKLKIDDIVTTTSKEALAVIEWWDWSVTRLWGDTSIKINNLYVSTNKDKLNISFELFKWKTWSNVISFIPEDSFFTQRFMDVEAAVRWTIFNVDLENEYLYVIEDQVDLYKQDWGIIQVWESEPLDLRTFTFIKFEEFLTNFRDVTFENINRMLDSQLFQKLKQELEKDMDKLIQVTYTEIDNLTDLEKNEVYNNLLSIYQELNFVGTADEIMYNIKIWIKEKLYQLAPEEDKKLLLNSFVDDFNDSVNNISDKSYESFWKIIKIIWWDLDQLEADIQSVVKEHIGNFEIPSWLKDATVETITDSVNVFKSIASFFKNIFK